MGAYRLLSAFLLSIEPISCFSAQLGSGIDRPIQKVHVLQEPHGIGREAEAPDAVPRPSGWHAHMWFLAYWRSAGNSAANLPIMNTSGSLMCSALPDAPARRTPAAGRRRAAGPGGSARSGRRRSSSMPSPWWLAPGVAPLVEDLDAELVAEVAGVEPARLELQDHLADQQLVRRRPHAAAQRQLAALQAAPR